MPNITMTKEKRLFQNKLQSWLNLEDIIKNKEYTPLYLAMYLGKYQKLSHSSWFDIKNINDNLYVEFGGATPLHLAILSDDIEKVKSLENLTSYINCQDNSGDSPLHLAIAINNSKITEFLINQGAKQNIKDIFDVVPAQLATLNLHFGSLWKCLTTKKEKSLINNNISKINETTNNNDTNTNILKSPISL